MIFQAVKINQDMQNMSNHQENEFRKTRLQETQLIKWRNIINVCKNNNIYVYKNDNINIHNWEFGKKSALKS